MDFLKDSLKDIKDSVKEGFKDIKDKVTDDTDGGLIKSRTRSLVDFVDPEPEPYTSSVNYLNLNFFKLDKILGMSLVCKGADSFLHAESTHISGSLLRR